MLFLYPLGPDGLQKNYLIACRMQLAGHRFPTPVLDHSEQALFFKRQTISQLLLIADPAKLGSAKLRALYYSQ